MHRQPHCIFRVLRTDGSVQKRQIAMFKFIKSLFKKKEEVWDTDTTKTTVPRVPSSQDEEPIPPGPPQLSTLLTKPFQGIPHSENMEPYFPTNQERTMSHYFYRFIMEGDEDSLARMGYIARLARKNDMTACEYMGDIYAQGAPLVKKDDRARIYYWVKAGKLGSLTAVRNLAYSYGRGLWDFPIDYEKAHLYWYLLYDHNPVDIEAKLYYLLGVCNGYPRNPVSTAGLVKNALGEIADELTDIPAAETANFFWAFNQIKDMAYRGDSRACELIKQMDETHRTVTLLNIAMSVLDGFFQ